jgi:hypothetical protein
MDLKKLERYLRVNLLGPGPSSYEKRIYRAAVTQRLRNTVLDDRHQGLFPWEYSRLPSCSADFRTQWSYAHVPLRVFMAC